MAATQWESDTVCVCYVLGGGVLAQGYPFFVAAMPAVMDPAVADTGWLSRTSEKNASFIFSNTIKMHKNNFRDEGTPIYVCR